MTDRRGMKKQFKTAAGTAYEVIFEKIINGELAPGEKLTRRSMAELTRVSIIPVIEALHRLENEGLVDSEPYFGSRVIRVTDAVIRDKFAMRLAVESQAVRMLTIRRPEDQIRHLTYLSNDLDSTPRDEKHAELFRQKHYAFHLSIAEHTECPSLVRALRRLNLLDLLQRTAGNFASSRRDVPRKLHQQIVDAIARGDPEYAEKIVREHIHSSGLLKSDDL